MSNYGHLKVSVINAFGDRVTRSVAYLVAKAFLEPQQPHFDRVVVCDGNQRNLRVDNLCWRDASFANRYARQLAEYPKAEYQNLAVENTMTNVMYESVYEAGVIECLLFDHIWKSTYTGCTVWPSNSVFEVVESM